ncbi:NUDIX domain-containing protein [Alcaligenes sp. SDU_A2]|uniref:NUDIX domain-containing protein n=1 Tax=Alcaligenes sp. SDU_A2 TaxID=3136634 RepID=UPI00311F6673
MKKLAVVIGRWQLPHLAHLGLIQKAFESAESVLVVIGSAFRSRTPKNPFTAAEREAMLKTMLTDEQLARVKFLPVRDYGNDRRWMKAIEQGLAAAYPDLNARQDVALVGHHKDNSSYYLDKFSWKFVEAPSTMAVDATAMRDVFFSGGDFVSVLAPFVAPSVINYLLAWQHLPAYLECLSEHNAVTAYRKKYTAPCYLTADAVVESQGHVLLIKRGGVIGHGQWALPGGFVDAGETFYNAALRELSEETCYRPLRDTMDAAKKGSHVFDHPSRSPRGRLVTTAYHFQLGASKMPEVRGADDAKEARWWPIDRLHEIEDQLFEDHALILDHFLKFIPTESAA